MTQHNGASVQVLEDNALQGFDQLLVTLFQSGVVTIVGSGWACGHGLPSMPDLASHLVSDVPKDNRYGGLDSADLAYWATLQGRLAEGVDLEQALVDFAAESGLLPIVETVVANHISAAESVALDRMFLDKHQTDMARFARYIGRVDNPISIITTNYDRLIEYAVRFGGYHVDGMFAGAFIGELDQDASRLEQKVWGFDRGRNTVKARQHVRLFKPHGSLDWYQDDNGDVFRTERITTSRRKIVTPGSTKLAAGYEPVFDQQRAGANKAIQEASGFFVIGFGFNDSHLETYLLQRIRSGVPTLILTKALSGNAAALVSDHPNVWALSESPRSGFTKLSTSVGDFDFPKSHAWSLSAFMTEVLQQE